MSLWSHLWTLTLLPLSLVGAFVLAMAWGGQSWLMVASLLAPLALVADVLIRWGR